ncbi:MAG: hypothetical protein E6772_03025 [Dysgonomonas sp.]|nr:hypothetical protein [Dysgonomonas sp.]
MTNFIKSMLLVAFLAITATSAQAQLLTATPNSVNYGLVLENTSSERDVTVSVSNLPLLATLTGFDLSITGANANMFSAEVPNVSLLELLSNLLAGKQTVKVTYHPTVASQTHTATLTIKATILGLSLPLTTTVQLTGRGLPQVAADNIFPANNSTNAHIDSEVYVEYNQFVSIVDPAKITINGQPAQRVEIVDNYFLKIYNTPSGSNNFARSTTYNIKVGAGAVTGNYNNPSPSDLSFSFTTTGAPTYTVNPAVGSTVHVPVDSESFIVNITFSEAVQVPNPPVEITDQDGNYYATLEAGSTPNTVQLAFFAIHVYENIGYTVLTIPAEYIKDVAGNPINSPITLSYTIAFDTMLRSISVDNMSKDEAIASETYYTLSGLKVGEESLIPGQVYIKTITFKNGTKESKKFIKGEQ